MDTHAVVPATVGVATAALALSLDDTPYFVTDREKRVRSRFACRGPGHGSRVDGRRNLYVALGDLGGVDTFVRQG